MQVSTGFIHGFAVTDWNELATFAVEAERMGVDSIWSPEGWGFDGATPLAYLAAKTSRIKLGTGVLQVGTRTPTNMAMTVMSLYSMSGGRFLLGIGTSGPQVIEGFHGVIFDNPIQRTRETIEIMKQVFNGERLAVVSQFECCSISSTIQSSDLGSWANPAAIAGVSPCKDLCGRQKL